MGLSEVASSELFCNRCLDVLTVLARWALIDHDPALPEDGDEAERCLCCGEVLLAPSDPKQLALALAGMRVSITLDDAVETANAVHEYANTVELLLAGLADDETVRVCMVRRQSLLQLSARLADVVKGAV